MKRYIDLFESFADGKQETNEELWAILFMPDLTICRVCRTLEEAHDEQRLTNAMMAEDYGEDISYYPEPGSDEDEVSYVMVDPSDPDQCGMLMDYCKNTEGTQIINGQDTIEITKMLMIHGVDPFQDFGIYSDGFSDAEELEEFLGEKLPLKEDKAWMDAKLEARRKQVKRRLGMYGMFGG